MLKKKPKKEPLEEKAEQYLNRSWFIIKREWKRIRKWLFFYQPEDKMDEMIHIFDIIVIIYITVRLVSA